MTSKNSTNITHTTQPYDKRALIIVGSIIGALIFGMLFYQAGFSAGVASVPAEQEPTAIDTTQDAVEEAEPEPREPIVLNGAGQQAADPVELIAGLATVKMKHSGESNFSIWVLDKYADRIELLVNEIGPFDGSKAFQVPADGTYTLDVAADGSWEVTIQQ